MNQLPRRLGHIVSYVCVGFISCFILVRPIYQFISIPFLKSLPQGTRIVYTNPTDPFTIHLKVAFIAGIFLSAPFSLFEIWKFIAPPLYSKEKKYLFPFMFASVVLFLLGGALCYYIVLPQTYGSLIRVGLDFQPIVKVMEYLDLTLTMLLGFGLIFLMPVIVAFLLVFRLASAKGSPGL